MAIPKRKITKRHTNIPRNVNSGEKPLFSSKGTMSVNKNGVLQNKKGVVYMTETRVTDVDIVETTNLFVDDVSSSSASCEVCVEPPGVVVTSVGRTTAAALTGVSITKTTEEFLTPIVVSDAYGNFVEMVRSDDKDDEISEYAGLGNQTPINNVPLETIRKNGSSTGRFKNQTVLPNYGNKTTVVPVYPEPGIPNNPT